VRALHGDVLSSQKQKGTAIRASPPSSSALICRHSNWNPGFCSKMPANACPSFFYAAICAVVICDVVLQMRNVICSSVSLIFREAASKHFEYDFLSHGFINMDSV
jgi:hypothetical protein